MAVDAAVELAFGVVQVHAAQVVETDDVAKLLKSALALFFGTQIVPGGEGVAGVDANADAALVFHAVDDRRQMFEFEAQVAALAGGVFDHRRHAGGFIQRDVDRFGDARQALVFIDLQQVAARVEVQQRQPQLFAALQLVDKRLARFFQRLGHRVAQVDQVAVVRQDLPRPEAILRAGALELIDHVGGQRRGLPLTLIFGEQGERGRLQFVRADNRLIHAA